MTDKTLLHPHDPFPALTVSLPGGRTLRLPDDLAGHFGVVLFYRGSWCPYCNAQLSAFQRALDGLAEMDVTVVALSVDDEATTQELIAKHGLRFPVGYGADASAIADATGAFVNDDPLFLQSTGFVLDPGGRVVVSVYSSGAIGRLVPQDVIGLIRYLREQRLAGRQAARIGLAVTGGEVRNGQLATPTLRTVAERPTMTRPRKGHRSHDRDARHTCATESQTLISKHGLQFPGRSQRRRRCRRGPEPLSTPTHGTCRPPVSCSTRGRVVISVYSSDAIGLIRYLRLHAVAGQ